jgi:NAD(P)-dependent dehydrogenase (short-subunit alcohol dehydrogenase family)
MIWTKGLAKQLAGKGIRVIWVASGPVWTPLQVTGGQIQEKLVVFGRTRRWGAPASLPKAPFYVALADPMLSYSTGQIFGAVGGDGGR